MNVTRMRKYARLIARKGANVQKNQEVRISASVEIAYFVKYVVEECYKAKASKVTVHQRLSIDIYYPFDHDNA